LRKWLSAGFLSCFLVAMVIGFLWTTNYWSAHSWLGSSVRSPGSSYLHSLGEILHAPVSAADRLKLALFLLSPVLCGFSAILAGVLGFLTLSGKRTWPYAAVLAALSIVGARLGMSALRALEDPIFFSKSPWVSSFKWNAYPIAGVAALYLIALVGMRIARRSQPAPVPRAVVH
jgi:hypothetical protein